jgi:hypothetical protein
MARPECDTPLVSLFLFFPFLDKKQQRFMMKKLLEVSVRQVNEDSQDVHKRLNLHFMDVCPN